MQRLAAIQAKGLHSTTSGGHRAGKSLKSPTSVTKSRPKSAAEVGDIVSRLTEQTTLAWENRIDTVPDVDGVKLIGNMGMGGPNGQIMIVRDGAGHVYHANHRDRHAASA